MTKTVRDIDRGFRSILRRVRALVPGPHVRIGVQGTEASDEREFGESNLAIASVHEFGSRDGIIPQRSYLRSTADREVALFQRELAKGAKRAAIESDVKTELGKVGELGVSKVKQTLDRSIGLKPLKQVTIDRRKKKSTKPLIDLGILKNSITWKVRRW